MNGLAHTPHAMPTASNLRAPSVEQLTAYFQSLFPVRKGDTQFLYHTPRRGQTTSSQGSGPISHVVLSITPTPGFYHALNSPASPPAATRQAPLAFLHRPWKLNRRDVPRGATTLSCHKGFDEVLTVGNNAALASKLGIDVSRASIIQGYKGDPERTIGIVGLMRTPQSLAEVRRLIDIEFGNAEGHFGFGESPERDDSGISVKAVAIMNAFHPNEVDRVAEAVVSATRTMPDAGIPDGGSRLTMSNCEGVLYLTGAVREHGLRAALEKKMSVVCVGHRVCEEWGIRYIAQQLRHEWPCLRVDEILEDEEQEMPRAAV